jgi:hypothetical protein
VLHDANSTGSGSNDKHSNIISTHSSCQATTSTTATGSSSSSSSSNSRCYCCGSEIISSCYGVDDLACLPTELLARVLALLPLHDRMVSCAAACRALQAAALAASADLVAPDLLDQRADAFTAWLAKPANASALRRMYVNSGVPDTWSHIVERGSLGTSWNSLGQLQSLDLAHIVLQPGDVSTQQQETAAGSAAETSNANDSDSSSSTGGVTAGSGSGSGGASSGTHERITINSGGAFDLDSLLHPLAGSTVNSSSSTGPAESSSSSSGGFSSLPAPVNAGSSNSSSGTVNNSSTTGPANNSSSIGLSGMRLLSGSGSTLANSTGGSSRSSSCSSCNPLTALHPWSASAYATATSHHALVWGSASLLHGQLCSSSRSQQ